ncbi:heme/copper-type cytochrome/quinol oxidase, subunit 2 [Belliella baltica DSM 15883]|uniref:Cytochrome c oxidase subunit 2 n=1 Tax=Belliella baltica (strain DSM 15883 / CIP 108006 / LMG 21964 / BA134) TaxID=866536 RepID=I3ZAK6_BELBD|nr:cytochrome c oxidase subunit II [Belliella baltica]AFL86274.1 heme/copper-type cytochrome/quinol oxidase, subunit 2 [Belliella baltica DSM 15883]
MYGFLIAVGILLLLSIIWMVYRIQTLVSVVKGSDKKIASSSNKVNAILFVVFLLVGGGLMFWYSIKEFDNYNLPLASEHGAITDNLFWITMAVTGIVFIITHILLFWFPYKYQYNEKRKATFYPDNNKLEVIWTIVPAFVLALLVIGGWKAWSDITAPAPENSHVVEIMGYQFAWEVRYPGMDNVLGNHDYRLINEVNNLSGVDFSDKNSLDDFASPVVYIPKGEPVLFKIRARDVLHSVFAPHMRLKMDAVPGMPTRFWFTPTLTTEEMRAQLGNEDFEYEIACTEICGRGHFSMKKIIKVVTPEEFEKWKSEQKPYIVNNPALVENLSVELKELADITISEHK